MIGDGCRADADDPVSAGSLKKWPVTGWITHICSTVTDM